jgi:hypothetical protein
LTTQLATRIDSKTRHTLDKLHARTHIPIRVLTEKAILLLDEYYQQLLTTHKASSVDSNFIHLLDYSLKVKAITYEALAG